MAILESIAAANAAYGIIKTALGNGKETAGLISAVGKFLSAEEDVKEAIQKKKNSPITAITGSSEGDWEEFNHLEMLRQKGLNSNPTADCMPRQELGIGGSNGKQKLESNAKQLSLLLRKLEKSAWSL